MAKRVVTLAVLCIAAAGCGGNGGNAAVSKTFTYGPPSAASAPAGATDAVSSALSFKTGASADTAMSTQAALLDAANVLLGDPASQAAAPTQLPALVRAGRSRAFAALAAGSSLPADCYKVTANSVTFTNCKFTDSSDTTTSITVDGSISTSADTVTWNYTMKLAFSDTSASMTATYKDSGTFTVTATTAKGHDEADVSVSVTANGQSMTFGLAQAAELDVTHSADCSTVITGGTFEVKRVWTQKPSNASGDVFKDRGVKFNWTGCGSATVQFSVS